VYQLPGGVGGRLKFNDLVRLFSRHFRFQTDYAYSSSSSLFPSSSFSSSSFL
jgi:hypothetical protein